MNQTLTRFKLEKINQDTVKEFDIMDYLSYSTAKVNISQP